MRAPRTTGLLLVCLAILCATSVYAEPIRVYTTANSDGRVSHREGYSDGYQWNWSQGDRTSTVATAQYDFRSGYDDWGSYLYNSSDFALLQFPLAGLRGKVLTPNSTTLHFYGNSLYIASSTVGLYGANFDGGGVLCQGRQGWENMMGSFEYQDPGTIEHWQVSYACSQPTSHHVAYVSITSTAAWHEVDITADLQRQINAGYNWAGYFFSMTHVPGQTASVATYEDSAHRPYLEVVPEPSGLFALMAGISGLAGVCIRRRK